jgi:ATP-binding cassette, subfamily B, bacterial
LITQRIELLRLLLIIPTRALIFLTLAMLCKALLPAATAVAVAWLIRRVADTYTREGPLADVTWPMLVVGLMLTLDQVAQSLLVPYRDWTAARVNGEIRHRVRGAVSVRPGIDHLESQVVRDAASLPVNNAYLFNLGAGAEGQLWLLTRFVGALAAVAVVARYSILAALLAFVFVVWQRSILRRHYAKAISHGMVETINEGRASTYWSEILGTPSGAKELRMFGFGDWALQRFYAHGQIPVKELSGVLLGAQRLHLKVFVLNGLGALLPFALLARMAINGEINAIGLAAALGGIVAISQIIADMGWEAFSIEASVPQLAAVDRLMEFHTEERLAASVRQPNVAPLATVDRNPDTPGNNKHKKHHKQTEYNVREGNNGADNNRPNDEDRNVPTITFDDVSFSYPGAATPVLSHLDLTLVAGESVAIVGENGAGKTTMLKLLAGFYQPTSGRILVDGVDMRDLDPARWRQRLAMIFQEFTRFPLSAFENVALANPKHANALEFANVAATAASAAQIIAGLPQGWETILSRDFTGGVDLSGGQWQRIALARALYCAQIGSQVLILDEPTASLDVDAEVALFDQLLSNAKGCTALVVSHRYSTVRRAERIVVLANGRVAEDGSHQQLHALGGTYARLYDLQANRFLESDVPPEAQSDTRPEATRQVLDQTDGTENDASTTSELEML